VPYHGTALPLSYTGMYGKPAVKLRAQGSNLEPAVPKTVALPIELPRIKSKELLAAAARTALARMPPGAGGLEPPRDTTLQRAPERSRTDHLRVTKALLCRHELQGQV
jgi:hypothetical protein